MKAFVYTRSGGTVISGETDRPIPAPGPGEVLVRVHASGVNPIDWKTRTRAGPEPEQYVPNHDGVGVVDAVGDGVESGLSGQRVWVWAAGWQRAEGTAQEYVVLPRRLVVPLPETASSDLGASIGIPALTAHRCLTVADSGPTRLAPGTLSGRTVLVAGGAGAVGHAAIQLALWAGATVLTTVSGDEKARLAIAARAHHTVNYRVGDPARELLRAVPGGMDIVVEVDLARNAKLDRAVLAPGGVVAFYGGADNDEITLPVREQMTANARWQGVFLYRMRDEAARHGVAGVSAALGSNALSVGEENGLPVHHYERHEVAAAHDALEMNSVVGKAIVRL